jgi:4-amino-4-deoxy-L-arabinose transferase-like glycosyltransferase
MSEPSPPGTRLAQPWILRWWDRFRKIPTEWPILVAVTLIGITARWTNLGGPSLWNDEGASSLLAFQVLGHGLPYIPGRPETLYLVNSEPLYPFLEAASFQLLGVSSFAARAPAALFGTGLIPLSYLLGRSLRGRYSGLALSLLVTFSTELIAWSRQARGYILVAFFLTLLFLCVSYSIHRWNGSPPRRARLLAMVATATILLGLASFAITLLYLPGLLLAGALVVLLSRTSQVRHYFGWGPSSSSPDSMAAERTRRRRLLLYAGLLVLVAVLVLITAVFPAAFDRLFRLAFPFSPYPFVFTPFYGSYLLDFYGVVVAVAAVGLVWVIRSGSQTERAMALFLAGAFLSLSTLQSLVVNVSGGVLYERYLTPLLVPLLYFAAVGIEGITRWAWELLRPLRWSRDGREAVRRVGFALGVAALVLLPGAVFPSDQIITPNRHFSTSNETVPWVAFSPDPRLPSALFDIPEPNYALAASYILAHRNGGDVTGAIHPNAPYFYLHSVTYWFIAVPPRGSYFIQGNLTREIFTGSIQLGNASAFEAVAMESPGWYIQDEAAAAPAGPSLQMAIALIAVPASGGSDSTVTLYHWNRTSPLGILETYLSREPYLETQFGNNTTKLVNWTATEGVTSSPDRDLFIGLEPYLITHCDNYTRPLAVLYSVFNSRSDLQAEFPGVFAGNSMGLQNWAYYVVNDYYGLGSDPAYPILVPYTAAIDAYYAAYH